MRQNWNHIRKILRIVLMCLILVISLFPVIGAFQIFIGNGKKEWFALIPFVIFACTIGSILFHLEVLRQKRKLDTGSGKIKTIYWILNTVLGFSFIFFGGLIFNQILNEPITNEDAVKTIYAVCSLIVLLGAITIIDMFFVYHILRRDKKPLFLSEIEKIGSQVKDEL